MSDKEKNEINYNKVHEVVSLSSKILKIFYKILNLFLLLINLCDKIIIEVERIGK